MTPREREVFDLSEAGLSRRQIAARMGIKERTVENLLQRVCVHSRSPVRTDAIRGSAALLAAICRHCPEQLQMQPGRRACL